MTWQQFAEKYLSDNGMFEDGAKAVVALAIEHKLFAAMKGRWNDNISGYPEVMKTAFLLSLRAVAVEWIESNKPAAWYKACFQD